MVGWWLLEWQTDFPPYTFLSFIDIFLTLMPGMGMLGLQVLSTDGDSQLGGDDFTRALAALILSKVHLSKQGMPDTPASSKSSSPQLQQREAARDGLSTEGLPGKGVGGDAGGLLAALNGRQRLAVLQAAEAVKQQVEAARESGGSLRVRVQGLGGDAQVGG